MCALSPCSPFMLLARFGFLPSRPSPLKSWSVVMTCSPLLAFSPFSASQYDFYRFFSLECSYHFERLRPFQLFCLRHSSHLMGLFSNGALNIPVPLPPPPTLFPPISTHQSPLGTAYFCSLVHVPDLTFLPPYL